MKRAVSVTELLSMKFDVMNFQGEWLDSFGEPELSGSWLIWGSSGSGKTYFSLQLCKYLSQFGAVAFDSLEMGVGKALQRAVKLARLSEIPKGRIQILNQERFEPLKERLCRHKSPRIVVIDSFQHMGIRYTDYLELKEQFPDKLFVFISHADGKKPRGLDADLVRSDADVKIYVEGFAAYPASRFGGEAPFIIWREKYNELNNL